MDHSHSSIQNNVPAHERLLTYLEREIHTPEHQRLQVRVSKDPHPPIEMLYDYAIGASSDQDVPIIRNHLELCARCTEEVLRIRLIEADMASEYQNSPPFFREYANAPLPVTAVYDRNTPDLIHEYYHKPLMDRLAASTGTSSELAFPMTVEYAGGQIIGEFWRRAGYPGQLFYKLKKSAIEQETYICTLVYTSGTDSSDVRTFELHEGENKRIGDFREFVTTETKQEMLKMIRQFRLFVSQMEEE